MALGSLEDRLLIRERYDAYADAAFRGDLAAYLDCWVQDGERVWAGTTCRGRAALAEQWTAIWAGLERMTFFTQLGPIEIDGDAARGRAHGLEMLHLKGGGRRTVVGRYEDHLVREGGRWLFRRREYHLHMDEGLGAGPPSGAQG